LHVTAFSLLHHLFIFYRVFTSIPRARSHDDLSSLPDVAAGERHALTRALRERKKKILALRWIFVLAVWAFIPAAVTGATEIVIVTVSQLKLNEPWCGRRGGRHRLRSFAPARDLHQIEECLVDQLESLGRGARDRRHGAAVVAAELGDAETDEHKRLNEVLGLVHRYVHVACDLEDKVGLGLRFRWFAFHACGAPHDHAPE
jgi:hypothetical protein